MRNTGTIYSSTERSPTVLPEMAELLPPLTGEQLAALEADILANGCYSPVIVNEDMVIVDTEDALLVCAKDAAQDIKKVIENLKICNRNELI